jgi:hypothetical protein
MGCDDAHLIERWQQGDVAAFEALVRRWQQPVGRFLFRLVGRSDLVHDLCQEVFLRVYLAGPRYRPNAAFSSGSQNRPILRTAANQVVLPPRPVRYSQPLSAKQLRIHHPS